MRQFRRLSEHKSLRFSRSCSFESHRNRCHPLNKLNFQSGRQRILNLALGIEIFGEKMISTAFIPIYPALQSSYINSLSRRHVSRPRIRQDSYQTFKSCKSTIRFNLAVSLPPKVGTRIRHVLAAVSIPILPVLPTHASPSRFSHISGASLTTISSEVRAPRSKSPALALRIAAVPSVAVSELTTGRFGALQPIIPTSKDSRLHVALKCALLAAIVSSIVTAATIAVFWVIQDSLVYKPTKVWRGTPKSSGMPFYDDVNYCTFDGVEISGWFIKQPPEIYRDSRTLVYFHGTDKNASFRLKKVVGFYEQCKCNVLLLSYRGYGLSSGHPNERGMCIDAESALDYLASRGDVDVSPGGNLWVYGESLGGAVAVHFTKVYQERINALILENTFTSLLDMIKLEFPILGIFRYLSRNRWQSKRRIRDIKTPILFLSGLRDAYIPPRMMKQMHELANQSVLREFVEFEKGTHNRTWTMDGFYSAVASFMERVERETNSDTQAAVAGSGPTNFTGDDKGFIAATA